MVEGKVRYAQLVWEALDFLRMVGEPVPRQAVTQAVADRLQPTPHESEPNRGGSPRWLTALNYHTGDAATVGWMTKRGGWAITEAGLEALATFTSPAALFSELNRRYREIDQRRKQAQVNLNQVEQFIALVLRMVEPGTWTSHDDLAELAGTTGAKSAKVETPLMGSFTYPSVIYPCSHLVDGSCRIHVVAIAPTLIRAVEYHTKLIKPCCWNREIWI